MHVGCVPESKASISQQTVLACQLGVVPRGSLSGTLRLLVQQMAHTQLHTHGRSHGLAQCKGFICFVPSATYLEWLLCDCTSSF